MNYVVYTIKKINRTSTANYTLFHSEILHLLSESSSLSLGEPLVQSHPYCMFPATGAGTSQAASQGLPRTGCVWKLFLMKEKKMGWWVSNQYWAWSSTCIFHLLWPEVHLLIFLRLFTHLQNESNAICLAFLNASLWSSNIKQVTSVEHYTMVRHQMLIVICAYCYYNSPPLCQ